MSGRQPCLSSPLRSLCRYAQLAIPLYPRSSLWPLAPGHNWTSSRVVWTPTLLLLTLGVAQLPIANWPSLLACLQGRIPPQTPLPFACLFIFLFSLAPLRNPAPDYPTPGKMWITLPSRSCPLLASLVPPIGRTCSLCIIIWSNWAFSVFLWPSYVSFFPTSLVCSLHSRLVICSVQSLRLVHPQLALFPSDQLPLPTSMTSYRSHASPVRLGRPSGALHVSHYFYAHTSQDHCNCRCTCWREHPLTMSVSQPFF